MSRGLAICVTVIASILLPESPSEGRLNPIRYLTEQVIRPEIVLVFDNSGSMDWTSSGTNVGNDCSGNDTTIDVCGDHICSGHERRSSCAADCQIYDTYDSDAGSAEKCYFGSTSSPGVSRMYLSRRAMQNVVADFRSVASFGLVTFGQSGFYRYTPANTSATTRTVGLYLHQWELRSAGSWVGGVGWDDSTNRPRASFVRHAVTYTLDGGSAGNSLYRRVAERPTPSPAFKGWSGCSSTNRCDWGQGDCDSNTECQTGLVCGQNNGPDWFAPNQYDYSPYNLGTLDICVPDPRNPATASFQYLRRAWSGIRYNDGTYDWEYMGSYYTYTAHGTGGTLGGTFNGWDGCLTGSPCGTPMTGDCDSDSHCTNGLVCIHNRGFLYFPSGYMGMSQSDIDTIDVCDVPGGAGMLSEFKGPEYVDSSSQLWVYNRFGPRNYGDAYGVTYLGGGQIQVPLYEATDASTQAEFDQTLGQVLNRMNTAAAGGIMGEGSTPTCAALQTAIDHVVARRDGTGAFSAPDFAGSCRPRFVVVISDGESNPDCSQNGVGGQMQTLVRALYDIGVKSYAVTIPGVSSSGRAEMDLVADVGDDGEKNGSAAALYSNSEKELVDNIRRVLFDAIKGQYTTTAAGVASSGSTTVVGDLAVIPSVEFPGWYGHLRTVDLTKTEGEEGYERWDAGDVLNNTDWKLRRLFTGRQGVNSDNPIPLLSTDGLGTPNLSGGCGGCGSYGAKDVWPGTPPADDKIRGMLRWLAGKDRPWKLGSLIRSVPATVGPPPTRKNQGLEYQQYVEQHKNRQRLVYVSSNEGVLHAFDVKTGYEVFGFIPPELLPAIMALYEQGGQSDNPQQVEYLMTSSPRLGDLKDPTQGWRTYLIQTLGMGGDQFHTLDITSPTTCSDPANTSTCALNDPALRVVFSSSSASPSIADKLGETWSIPSMFWTSALAPRVAMGSGYADPAAEGEWYNLFKVVGSSWSSATNDFVPYRQSPAGLGQVRPFALVPNTVAVLQRKEEGTQTEGVIATYQADPLGRVYRFEQGDSSGSGQVTQLLDFGETQPLLFPPAVIKRDEPDRATLALVGGAYQEQDIQIGQSSLAFAHSGSAFASQIYIRTEAGGALLSNDSFSCLAGDLCNAACYGGGTLYPSPCTGPSSRAIPVSQPLLVRNKLLGDRTEAFFLLYDPPEQVCTAQGEVSVGNSWVARVALHPNGTAQDLVQMKKFENTQASGLVIVGGGQDVAVSVTGRGNQKAGAQTISGTRINPESNLRPVRIESWKEVR